MNKKEFLKIKEKLKSIEKLTTSIVNLEQNWTWGKDRTKRFYNDRKGEFLVSDYWFKLLNSFEWNQWSYKKVMKVEKEWKILFNKIENVI